MANQFQTEPRLNPRQSTMRVIAARVNVLRLLSVATVALFLFLGAAHAQTSGPCNTAQSYCLFVSDFHNGTVQLWKDNGTVGNHSFLQGAGGGEGISCLSGSANVMYTAPQFATNISAWNLTTGAPLPSNTYNEGGSMGSLDANSAGTVLYVGAYGVPTVSGLAPVIPPASPWFTPLYQTPPANVNTHDASVGRNGNVFATHFQYPDTGVKEFDPTLATLIKQFLPGILPNLGTPCAVFSGSPHCWHQVSGMAWDAQGNLWVSSDTANDNGIFEFDPNGNPLNFTPDPGGFPIGLTVAPTTDPSNPGYVIVANTGKGDVPKINPVSCTGLPGNPGTCTLSPFISIANFNGKPKYPVYYTSCPNPDHNGYVEICKQSDPLHPVTGIFDFTATIPFFSSGTIEVPVGQCSGSIQVPSGAVTVTESPVLGVAVSNVTAYAYDELGFYHDELNSWSQPDLHAIVNVMAGDEDEETLTTFTNYAAPPG